MVKKEEPFYLHPAPGSGGDSGEKKSKKKETTASSKLDERLRQYSAYELNRKPVVKKRSSQVSCSDQESSGSFFLHDPSVTVGYNRLSDLFPSSQSSTAGQTVCSDDSGVGLASYPSSKSIVLTRPKNKPPKPPVSSCSITGESKLFVAFIVVESLCWSQQGQQKLFNRHLAHKKQGRSLQHTNLVEWICVLRDFIFVSRKQRPFPLKLLFSLKKMQIQLCQKNCNEPSTIIDWDFSLLCHNYELVAHFNFFTSLGHSSRKCTIEQRKNEYGQRYQPPPTCVHPLWPSFRRSGRKEWAFTRFCLL